MIGSLAVLLCPAAAQVAVTSLPASGSSAASDTLGAAVAFALMGACSLVYAVTRSTAVRRTFVTSRRKLPASLDLLRYVARRRRTHALAFSALWIIAGAAIATLPIARETRLVLEVTPALMCAVGLVHAFQLGRLLHRAASSELQVLAHGEFLYAAQGSRLVGWVSASPRLFDRASQLPVARVHRVA